MRVPNQVYKLPSIFHVLRSVSVIINSVTRRLLEKDHLAYEQPKMQIAWTSNCFENAVNVNETH